VPRRSAKRVGGPGAPTRPGPNRERPRKFPPTDRYLSSRSANRVAAAIKPSVAVRAFGVVITADRLDQWFWTSPTDGSPRRCFARRASASCTVTHDPLPRQQLGHLRAGEMTGDSHDPNVPPRGRFASSSPHCRARKRTAKAARPIGPSKRAHAVSLATSHNRRSLPSSRPDSVWRSGLRHGVRTSGLRNRRG